MRYLLDVNVLVAWGWADHADHERVAIWIAGQKRMRVGKLLTSAIPHLGFVRVSVQRTGGQVVPREASQVLSEMLKALGPRHSSSPMTSWHSSGRGGATPHPRPQTLTCWRSQQHKMPNWPRSTLASREPFSSLSFRLFSPLSAEKSRNFPIFC